LLKNVEVDAIVDVIVIVAVKLNDNDAVYVNLNAH
jgi:hypothetical protein